MSNTNRARLAWISGGASGIGLASAHALGKQGFRVAISGRNTAKLEAAVTELTAQGIAAIGLPLDVADEGAVAVTATTLIAEHGPVEVLVAAAGINVPNRFWRDLTATDFAKVTATNLNGVANMVCAVLPGMREAGIGTVVVVSSWAGWRFLPFTGAAYGATKQGLAPLVESLNDQEGPNGIRATVICPGEVATPILRTRPSPPPEADIATMLKPQDVASAVIYVAMAPRHVCINELVISPTANRIYTGADDLTGNRG